MSIVGDPKAVGEFIAAHPEFYQQATISAEPHSASKPKPTDDWCVDCGRQSSMLVGGTCGRCHLSPRRDTFVSKDNDPVTVTRGEWRKLWEMAEAGAKAAAPPLSAREMALQENLRATQERCTAMLMERRQGPGAIRAKRLTETAILPKRAHPTDSGLDLHADIDAPIHIMAGTTRLIPTGIAVAIPPGYEGQVRPRSGLAVRSSAAAFLGTIDSAYRGNVGVIMHAHGPHSITVKPGDRIGQLVVAPVCLAELVEVDSLDETERGESGFGSTGTGAR